MNGVDAYPAYLGLLGVAGATNAWARWGWLLASPLLVLGALLAALRAARDAALLGVFALALLLGPVLVSVLGQAVALPGRYEVFALPAFALLPGTGAMIGPGAGRAVRVVLGGAWLAAAGALLVAFLSLLAGRPVDLLHGLLARQAGEVGEVQALGFAYAALRARDLAHPLGVPIRVVPAGMDRHAGWWDRAQGVQPSDLTAATPRGAGALWLVRLRGDPFEAWHDAQAAALLAAGWHVARGIELGGVRLTVFGQAPGKGGGMALPRADP